MKALALALLAGLVSLAALAESALHPEDFAYGLALITDAQEALYATILPV